MENVRRIYVEKKTGYAVKAQELKEDLIGYLNMSGIEDVRMFIRYDVENISDEVFEQACRTVFSEPPVDILYRETIEIPANGRVFSVEYLPGQFDQRADSAVQCVQFLKAEEQPIIRTAVTYLITGDLTDEEFDKIKAYCINPVDSRETGMEKPKTLVTEFAEPADVRILDGFTTLDTDGLKQLYDSLGLAMTLQDFKHIQKYFAGEEKRDPSMTEIRVLDTYWSDHCRHTTFSTELKNVAFGDGFYREPMEKTYQSYLDARAEIFKDRPDKFVCLMDLALMAMRKLKKEGKLEDMEQSDEINACSVIVPVEMDYGDGPVTEEWLVFFKNETHNHPTEIEPFGGAATCIGGAIRDPLSGRSYVYHAMRVTGGANPLAPIESTIRGKLPQRKLAATAAQGYSSYGNQIGIATGLVDEVYHDGYLAKHMEIGAVVGAAPERNVRREKPAAGDAVILLGGRTGRDGCGGATGSSKSHNISSLETCGAEVQKGNAPEERKLQRLFLNPEASTLIKCCNDFGAGGVSVAIGELADGLDIELDRVPKKYAGLDGTELAISESQERMAVVVAAADCEKFLALANGENLEATVVARVTDTGRMVMHWNGEKIVDLSREFLNTNGAVKQMRAKVQKCGLSDCFARKNCPETGKKAETSFAERLSECVSDINICSRQGLAERFDSTIGAATVLMPFGGKNMLTPTQAMAAKLPVRGSETDTCSVMAYGFDPHYSAEDPFGAAYCAVVTSVAKLVAAGASTENCWLTFQEYFEKLGSDPVRWGKPLAALLGALRAQLGLRLAAIGGKDSMSGTFENITVPPTLVSFAIAADKAGNIISPEFKKPGSRLVFLPAKPDENGLPAADSLRTNFALATRLIRGGSVLSAWAVDKGGAAEGLFKAALGNGIGVRLNPEFPQEALFCRNYGALILEIAEGCTEQIPNGLELGSTMSEFAFEYRDENVALAPLFEIYDKKLEPVYRHKTTDETPVEIGSFRRKAPMIKPNGRYARPRVLIPVFPGTNCEMDSARAMRLAGAEAEVLVINNITAKGIEESVNAFANRLEDSQILFIPGGFSGGDEPEGSAKLIESFMRNARAAEAIERLLNRRDGLILGICNGFQALIKLGLVPFGKIIHTDENCPTLTYNTIGLHRSRLVHTRTVSNLSPWLMYREPGEVSLVPVSHGEGRFVCPDELLNRLVENGQIATVYCDASGRTSMRTEINPNGSVLAVEGITSADGRVFGKMAHSERYGKNLYKNVPGKDESAIFRGAVDYFRL